MEYPPSAELGRDRLEYCKKQEFITSLLHYSNTPNKRGNPRFNQSGGESPHPQRDLVERFRHGKTENRFDLVFQLRWM
jgi:hypothetical protein